MSKLLRLFSFLFLAVFLTPIALAQTSYNTAAVGGFEGGSRLRHTAFGQDVFEPRTLLAIGGVLFQGTIDDALLQKITSARLERHGDSGTLVFTIDGKDVAYTAPYWILRPAILYGLDRYNAAASLYGTLTRAEGEALGLPKVAIDYAIAKGKMKSQYVAFLQECGQPSTPLSCESKEAALNLPLSILEATEASAGDKLLGLAEFENDYFLSELHEQFAATAVGLRLLQADSLLIDPSYRDTIMVRGKVAKFPGETEVSPSGGAINTCASSWILTDVGVEYRLKADGEKLSISGQPYYHAWDPDVTGVPTANSSCIAALKRADIAAYAPRVWAVVQQVGRLSALVRGLLAANPKIADELRKAALGFETYEFVTPRAWPKGRYRDFAQ